MELNGRTAPDGHTLDATVCIVGAGPAGLTLAHELEARGVQCAVIESGGYPLESESQTLNAAETTGDPYQDLRLARWRGAGGTAALWNTMFQGAPFAKYLPLDPLDFEARACIPWSGWPFGRAALESYYRRAQVVCRLGPFDYTGPAWSDPTAALLDLPHGSLIQSVYQYGPAQRFTVELPAMLAASPSATWIHGATVTGFGATGDGRLTEARWASLSGTRGVVRAAWFVLAAGAIENARLLLVLRNGTTGRPGDNWLGRGFMEHPVDGSLELSSRNPILAAAPGFFGARDAGRGTVVGRIGLSADLLRSENLRNASLRLFRNTEPVLMRASGLRSLARRLVPFPGWRRRIGDSIRRRYQTAPGGATRHKVLLDLEQAPHPENRVRLSDQRDRLGQPRAVVDWRWRAEDEDSRQRAREVFARELERERVGRLHPAAETPLDPAVHHHAGTTRMHPDPALGVVDENLRTHQMENLYLTGASVFPTAGVANPTLTVIALTLRLADHLSGAG